VPPKHVVLQKPGSRDLPPLPKQVSLERNRHRSGQDGMTMEAVRSGVALLLRHREYATDKVDRLGVLSLITKTRGTIILLSPHRLRIHRQVTGAVEGSLRLRTCSRKELLQYLQAQQMKLWYPKVCLNAGRSRSLHNVQVPVAQGQLRRSPGQARCHS
jgi:hypothetical protein